VSENVRNQKPKRNSISTKTLLQKKRTIERREEESTSTGRLRWKDKAVKLTHASICTDHSGAKGNLTHSPASLLLPPSCFHSIQLCCASQLSVFQGGPYPSPASSLLPVVYQCSVTCFEFRPHRDWSLLDGKPAGVHMSINGRPNALQVTRFSYRRLGFVFTGLSDTFFRNKAHSLLSFCLSTQSTHRNCHTFFCSIFC